MSMEDRFADAVDRLLSGEPIDAIVASNPEETRAELRNLLLVVEDVSDLALLPAPTPSPVRRSANRALFFQTAFEMQITAEAALVAEAPLVAPAAALTALPPRPSLIDAMRDWLQQFRGAPLGAYSLSLAPLAALLLTVYLATFFVVSAAQGAIPGDFIYPIKDWTRQQREALAPADLRSAIQLQNDAEIMGEVVELTERAANLREVVVRVSQELQYRGMDGRILLVGPLQVLPNYQPDLLSAAMLPITIEGDLRPGVPVRLEYQILPGNPSLVQGVSLVVVGAPEPTPQTAATPISVPDGNCPETVPPGWKPLAIFPGMTVPDIAARAGVSVLEITRVNCLNEMTFASRRTILAPDNYYIKVTPATMPTAPAPVYQPPAPLSPTPAPTRSPATSTPDPTEAATPTRDQTPAPTPADDQTPAPTPTPSGDQTPAATPTDNQTPAATPTDDLTPAPTPTDDLTPAATPTDNQTPAPTPTADATATAPAGATATNEPTTAATVDGSVTPEPTPEPTTDAPTAMPTQESTAAPTDAPTEAPTQAPTTAPTEIPTEAVAPTEPPAAAATPARPAPTEEREPTATAAPAPTATPRPAPTEPPPTARPQPTEPPPPPTARPQPTEPPPPPADPPPPDDPPDPDDPPEPGNGGEGA